MSARILHFASVIPALLCLAAAEIPVQRPAPDAQPGRMRKVDGQLWDAVVKRDLAGARKALESGADVHSAEPTGSTPLHRAAYGNNVPMVELLLEHGARIETAHGGTCLAAAAVNGSVDVASLLLDRGADVNARSTDGSTALHDAVGGRCPEASQLPLAKLLIDHGADVKAAGVRGATPLHEACRPELAELLLDHGADPNARDDDGRTPVFDAASDSDLNRGVVAFLARHGADVNARDKRGRTALHEAAAECNVDGARALLAAGADVSAKDDDGRTPLDLCRKFHVNGVITGGMKLQTLQVLENAQRRRAKEKTIR